MFTFDYYSISSCILLISGCIKFCLKAHVTQCTGSHYALYKHVTNNVCLFGMKGAIIILSFTSYFISNHCTIIQLHVFAQFAISNKFHAANIGVSDNDFSYQQFFGLDSDSQFIV